MMQSLTNAGASGSKIKPSAYYLPKKPEEIPETLERRYQNQLKRLAQYNAQDVFQIYANTLAEQYDPHTNYFSPRRAENFDINMSLSLRALAPFCRLMIEYAKVTRLVPAGPADKQGGLQALRSHYGRGPR